MNAKKPSKHEVRDAIVFMALQKLGDKRADRDHIADGTNAEIEFSITAKVTGHRQFTLTEKGRMSVGHGQSRTKREKPDSEELLAFFLSQITSTQRKAIVQKLEKQFKKSKGLPDVSKDDLHAAQHLIGKLSTEHDQSVRGSVSVKFD